MKVNYIVSHLTDMKIKDNIPCGLRRIMDQEYWKLIQEQINPNFIHLHKKEKIGIPFTETLQYLLFHLGNAHEISQKVDNGAISHIFFQEEASILQRTKLWKSVVTVLDVIHYSHPYMSSFVTRQCYKGLKYADRIISLSEHTKKDIIKYLHIPAEKITTIYYGINKIFQPCEIKNNFYTKHKLNPEDRFILCVSSLSDKRKNLPILIKILPQLKKKIPNLKLLLAGYIEDQKRCEVTKLIKKEKLESSVIIFEKIPDTDLNKLYNIADVFVFPSLYEGLGLPILEAMACGTPVVTGKNSSLPEAAGNAGSLTDTTNECDLTNAILRVLCNKKMRHNMIEKGYKHVSTFTWENNVKQTINIYKELYESTK